MVLAESIRKLFTCILRARAYAEGARVVFVGLSIRLRTSMSWCRHAQATFETVPPMLTRLFFIESGKSVLREVASLQPS